MSVNLTGMWKSVHTDPTGSWVDEIPGVMFLHQDGDQVGGDDRCEGVVYQLSGRVEGDAFLGTWKDPYGRWGSGKFTFTIKENGEILEGHYTIAPNNDRLSYRARRLSG